MYSSMRNDSEFPSSSTIVQTLVRVCVPSCNPHDSFSFSTSTRKSSRGSAWYVKGSTLTNVETSRLSEKLSILRTRSHLCTLHSDLPNRRFDEEEGRAVRVELARIRDVL